MPTRCTLLALALCTTACAGGEAVGHDSRSGADTTEQSATDPGSEPANRAAPRSADEPPESTTPVADGNAGMTIDFRANDQTLILALSPPVENGSWKARFSNRDEDLDLDVLCGEGSAESGVFVDVQKILSTGYSRALSSAFVNLEVAFTLDDTGAYEPGEVGILFVREGAPTCWTLHNIDYGDPVARGLFGR